MGSVWFLTFLSSKLNFLHSVILRSEHGNPILSVVQSKMLKSSMALLFLLHLNWIHQQIFFKINLYCSIITLQCCVSFCHAAKWISYTYTMSTLVWISFPLRSLQNFEFPVLYNRFSLLPYFIQSSVYMSTPISQFIPPLFPAWYSYTCTLQLCLYFCFANKFIYTIFLDSTYKWHYTIFVFLFLTYFTLYVGP